MLSDDSFKELSSLVICVLWPTSVLVYLLHFIDHCLCIAPVAALPKWRQLVWVVVLLKAIVEKAHIHRVQAAKICRILHSSCCFVKHGIAILLVKVRISFLALAWSD